MIEQLGVHGGFALDLRCVGDLHVDEHHTVEDCALVFAALQGADALMVVQDGQPVGVLTRHDLLGFLAR